MPLEVHRREVEGIVILDLAGRLVVGPEAGDLRHRFTQLIAQDAKRIILNLKQVDFIDSTGLGTLIVGHSTVEESGGAIKLLHLTKRTIQLLVLTKLSTIFEIFDDEQAAINSFFPDREVKRFDILEFVRSQEGEKQPLGTPSNNPPKPNEG